MTQLDGTVSHNIRALRRSKRWTLEETVDKMCVELGRTLTVGAYSRWETGDNVRSRWSTSELLAFCTVFEVPLARIMLPDIDDPWQDHEAIDVWNTLFAFTSHVRPWWPLQAPSSTDSISTLS